MNRLTRNTPLLALALIGLSAGFVLGAPDTDLLDFSDPKARTADFMRLYDEIELTEAQETIKHDALSVIPAACCADNSAYTCCCPCNLSKTVWGLSAWLITEQGADAETVRSEVQRWYASVNDGEFPGDSCYTGGCGKPFSQGGCGGMHAGHVVFEG